MKSSNFWDSAAKLTRVGRFPASPAPSGRGAAQRLGSFLKGLSILEPWTTDKLPKHTFSGSSRNFDNEGVELLLLTRPRAFLLPHASGEAEPVLLPLGVPGPNESDGDMTIS
mmetsp:Transcript_12647/g.34106  ORF Transcript_12647/g.34106 Transcript_12647/m.34106 type:complete len:112 (-) Transcript_12647:84-419(-)